MFLQTCSFSLHKTLIDWSGVDYCDVFISCLNSHSDGTHSLQRIHWWASDVMLNFSKSVVMKKQTHLILDGLRVSTFSALCHFWVNNSFKWHNHSHRPPFSSTSCCFLTSEGRTVGHALAAVGWSEASKVTEGFAHWAGILGQTFYVLKSQVDDLIGAGVAVEVAAGETLQPGLERDAALAVRNIRVQRQTTAQRTALHAGSLTRAQLCGWPARPWERKKKNRWDLFSIYIVSLVNARKMHMNKKMYSLGF